MFKDLFKMIDPKKFGFVDKCTKDTQRGLGILCGTYVFFIILGLIINILQTIVLFTKCRDTVLRDTPTTIEVILFTMISIGWSVFTIVFMINACRMCNGLYAFFFLLLVGIIVAVVNMLLLNRASGAIMQCMLRNQRK